MQIIRRTHKNQPTPKKRKQKIIQIKGSGGRYSALMFTTIRFAICVVFFRQPVNMQGVFFFREYILDEEIF